METKPTKKVQLNKREIARQIRAETCKAKIEAIREADEIGLKGCRRKIFIKEKVKKALVDLDASDEVIISGKKKK